MRALILRLAAAPRSVLQDLQDLMTAEGTCRVLGHDPSWVLGAQLGQTRPCCARCKRRL